MFVTKKRYNDEKELLERRMAEFENTLHELYDAHLELRSKYNQLLTEKNDIHGRLDVIEQDISLRIGDRGK